MIDKRIKINNSELSIQTGELAKQANGSVMVQYGETVVLVAITGTKNSNSDKDFLPLSVDYREKFYAAGKIPGGFFKREARPSEREIIAARLTDRPIRPLFPEGYNEDVFVSINVLSYDGENEPDVLGTIGASAALMISDIPYEVPVASVRVAQIDGKFIVNPTNSELEENVDMEVIVSGTDDSIVMVEGKANFVKEQDFLSALEYAHEIIKDIVKLQSDLQSDCGKTKFEYNPPEKNKELTDKIDKLIDGKLGPLNEPKNKEDRYNDIDVFVDGIASSLEEEYPDDQFAIKDYVHGKIGDELRTMTLAGKRADGRKFTDVRDITIRTSCLPRTHGSAVFTRGETQALVVSTLGSKRDEQMLDNINGNEYSRLMLHYNFPPFCVGDAKPKFSVSRREIGHGNLALRAISDVIPEFDDFPYTIRLVSEILESNGSSSMASVCGSILALMDAGVPIKTPIAGIAMGLVMESEKNYAILSDILGTEDHLGDMDFKVAGSKDGITAIQMDLKIKGLPMDIMSEALEQARLGRLEILEKMESAMSEPRAKLSEYAPKVSMGKIPVDKIGDFIGPGGKNIKSLIEEYECEIGVEQDGSCVIMGMDQENIDTVKSIVDSYSFVPEVGSDYDAEVVRILEFGCFVRIAPTVEGLVHISKLAWEHVKKVEDKVSLGDKVRVRLEGIDDMKRLNLSMRALMEKPEGYVERPSKPKFSGNKNRNSNSKRKSYSKR